MPSACRRNALGRLLKDNFVTEFELKEAVREMIKVSREHLDIPKNVVSSLGEDMEESLRCCLERSGVDVEE